AAASGQGVQGLLNVVVAELERTGVGVPDSFLLRTLAEALRLAGRGGCRIVALQLIQRFRRELDGSRDPKSVWGVAAALDASVDTLARLDLHGDLEQILVQTEAWLRSVPPEETAPPPLSIVRGTVLLHLARGWQVLGHPERAARLITEGISALPDEAR